MNGKVKNLAPPKPSRPPISTRNCQIPQSINNSESTSELARFIDDESSSCSEAEENVASNQFRNSAQEDAEVAQKNYIIDVQIQVQKKLIEFPQTSTAALQRVPPQSLKIQFGLQNLLHQVQLSYLKNGFVFNLMVIGEYGLGKTSLLEALFNTPHLFHSNHFDGEDRLLKNGNETQLRECKITIDEGGLKLHLNLIDTPGFGDSLNNSSATDPLINYLENQLEHHLQEEYFPNYRPHRSDKRVHLAIYMVNPNARTLRPIDLWFLRCLSQRVNIVPVIAKADTLTRDELLHLKMRLQTQLHMEELQLFNCSLDPYADEFRCLLSKLIPFGVVSPDNESFINLQNSETHSEHHMTRSYPWGDLQIENPNHCEFLHLRVFIISNMKHLVDLTHEKIYENYRFQRCSFLLRPRERLRDSETQTSLFEML